MEGKVRLTLWDAETGEAIETRTPNTVTNPGKFWVWDRAKGTTSVSGLTTTEAYIGVGTGSATNTAWDTALTTEISGIGNPGRKLLNSITRTAQTVSASAQFSTTDASGAITECGLFVKSYDSGGALLTPSATKDSGVMFSKAVFSAITKDSSNILTADWEISP